MKTQKIIAPLGREAKEKLQKEANKRYKAWGKAVVHGENTQISIKTTGDGGSEYRRSTLKHHLVCQSVLFSDINGLRYHLNQKIYPIKLPIGYKINWETKEIEHAIFTPIALNSDIIISPKKIIECAIIKHEAESKVTRNTLRNLLHKTNPSKKLFSIGTDSVQTTKELSALTVTALRNIARNLCIKGVSKSKKSGVIREIQLAQAEQSQVYVLEKSTGEKYHLNYLQTHDHNLVTEHDFYKKIWLRIVIPAFKKRRKTQIEEQNFQENLKNTYVTLRDSLQSGNCESKSLKFKELLEQRFNLNGECAVRADVILSIRDDNYTRRAIYFAMQNR